MQPAPAAPERAASAPMQAASAPAQAAPASAPESGVRPARKRRKGLIIGLGDAARSEDARWMIDASISSYATTPQ